MLINKQNKAVIFDMDGVIFDSEQAVFNGWKELSQKYGFENLDIPYMKCIGVNAASSKRIFLDYYGADFPMISTRMSSRKIITKSMTVEGFRSKKA